MPFTQTAQERTSVRPHAEALSAGEASLFAVRHERTLSVAAFGVFITKCYVTTFCAGLQAQGRFFWFCLYFCCPRAILDPTFYWKEGAPTWVGTAAFSLKKETPKLFRLEVRPFLGGSLKSSLPAKRGIVVFMRRAALLWGVFVLPANQKSGASFHLLKMKGCFPCI